MRIIAGSLRGKKILQPQNNVTRPLKDLTKESIFNIIHHSNLFECKLTNSRVLDLFSGVGSFGLECLSRGAKSVWFCENNSTTLEVLRKNISLLDCEDKSKIIQGEFSLKNLSYFIKCTNLCNSIEMYLENNLPLIVKYSVASLGSIKLCLAPLPSSHPQL